MKYLEGGLFLQHQGWKRSALILIGWTMIMYVANAWMPLFRDDYMNGVIWYTGDHFQSLGDLFDSTYRYFEMHGGRLTAFFLQFFFVYIGKSYFDIVNALFFSALILLIAMHAKRSVRVFSEPALLLAIGIFLWLGLPHFGEVAIWMCGSVVYLWTAVFALIFFLPYNLALRENASLTRGGIKVL